MKTGFIGLGHMGSAMAANLVKAGHDVTVFNRSREKLRALLELGAHEAGTVADACHGEVVVTMLADDTAVADVALAKDGIVETLAKGAIHLSMSTISVGAALRRGASLRPSGRGGGSQAVHRRLGRGCCGRNVQAALRRVGTEDRSHQQ